MLSNFKFSYKITLLPLIAALAFTVILTANMITGDSNKKILNGIETGYVPALELSRDLEDMLADIQRGMQDAVAAGDEEMLWQLDSVRDKFMGRLEAGKSNPAINEEEIENLKTGFINYFDITKETCQRIITGEAGEDIASAMEEMLAEYNKIKNNLASSTHNKRELMASEFELARKSQETSFRLIIVITLICLAIMIVLSAWIIRGVIKPFGECVRFAMDVGEGDLSGKLEINTRDETRELGDSLNRMVENLREMVTRIQSTSSSVASAADDISAATGQIAKGAQSQASASDETGASMEEMAAQIQMVAKNADGLASNVDETTTSIQQMGTTAEGVARNAESMASNVSETSATIEQMFVTFEKTSKNVEQADQLSQQASLEARTGGEAVLKTVEGMRGINEMMGSIASVIQGLGQRSESIGGILEVIEDIADQTNLLALNAAIEAARAGDVGRGFAVVAEEVRKLAERSMKATKEIGDVIKKVQKDTGSAVKATEEGARSSREGIELADRAGAAINGIMDSVNSTSRIMQEISSATKEQSTAAGNVIKAVEEMNSLTQTVSQSIREQAAGSRQVVKASELMAQMTEQVKNATTEQKKGGENVIKAIENINDIAKSNLSAVDQLTHSANDMTKQSESLQDMVKSFKIA